MPPIADNLNLRVILAGRTGLESTLRRDPGIELIRARTPLDALGELADPIDTDSPHHTAVILDPDLAADPAATLELQQAIKVIQPSAITLLATSNTHTNGHSTSNLDGTIPPRNRRPNPPRAPRQTHHTTHPTGPATVLLHHRPHHTTGRLRQPSTPSTNLNTTTDHHPQHHHHTRRPRLARNAHQRARAAPPHHTRHLVLRRRPANPPGTP
jgi:hypothetical protein